MRGGYESLIWINDKNGREFVCYRDDIKDSSRSYEELSDEERKSCDNVNQLVGTERW